MKYKPRFAAQEAGDKTKAGTLDIALALVKQNRYCCFMTALTVRL